MKKMWSLSYTKRDILHLLEEGNAASCSKIDELTSVSDIQREMSRFSYVEVKRKCKEIDLNVE